MPADEQKSLPELPAKYASMLVRIAHKRPAGSTEWMSTQCAFGLDGCRESDCGCRCHPRFRDISSNPPAEERTEGKGPHGLAEH